MIISLQNKVRAKRGESKHSGSRFDESKHQENKSDERTTSDSTTDSTEEEQRVAEVKVISSTHGHIVSILKVHVCPRPFVLNRTLRFQEVENSIMKRRVLLLGHENNDMYSNAYLEYSNKFVHCVEGGVPAPGKFKFGCCYCLLLVVLLKVVFIVIFLQFLIKFMLFFCVFCMY